jgi:hypothetical protein
VTAAALAYGLAFGAWLAHVAAILIAICALTIAVRLRWSPPTVLLAARVIVWAGVAAAWGVASSLGLAVVVERISFRAVLTSYGTMCGFTAAVALGSSFVLSRAIARTSGSLPPRPWTTF